MSSDSEVHIHLRADRASTSKTARLHNGTCASTSPAAQSPRLSQPLLFPVTTTLCAARDIQIPSAAYNTDCHLWSYGSGSHGGVKLRGKTLTELQMRHMACPRFLGRVRRRDASMSTRCLRIYCGTRGGVTLEPQWTAKVCPCLSMPREDSRTVLSVEGSPSKKNVLACFSVIAKTTKITKGLHPRALKERFT